MFFLIKTCKKTISLFVKFFLFVTQISHAIKSIAYVTVGFHTAANLPCISPLPQRRLTKERPCLSPVKTQTPPPPQTLDQKELTLSLSFHIFGE